MNFRIAKYSLSFKGVASSRSRSILGIGIAHPNSSSVVEKVMSELESGSEPATVRRHNTAATAKKRWIGMGEPIPDM